jgi:hypothetical protein
VFHLGAWRPWGSSVTRPLLTLNPNNCLGLVAVRACTQGRVHDQDSGHTYFVGVDVSKDWLDVVSSLAAAPYGSQTPHAVSRRWLRGWSSAKTRSSSWRQRVDSEPRPPLVMYSGEGPI